MYRMPFGKYKGRPVQDLPDVYLEWLHGQGLDGKLLSEVSIAIEKRTKYKSHGTGISKYIGYYNPITKDGGRMSYGEYLKIKGSIEKTKRLR